ncbi:MAG TPA: carboxypeptidase-like regulatory domain-containing protein, partial [Pirellulaceae bacterium]|nr:carboxypeptidase-like regulatory domain-containing protein [Pirellulaceae bacterium]
IIRLLEQAANPDRGTLVYHPAEFVCIATPSVPVEGRVTDRSSGQPLAGMLVQGYKVATNEVHGGLEAIYIHAMTDADGRYEIPVLPGLGILAFRAENNDHDYPRGVGADTIDGPKTVTNGIFFRTVPYQCMAINFHLLTGLNPAADAEELEVDLTLTPGRSLIGRVVDPSGQPLDDFYLLGHRWGGWTHHRGASFEIKGYVASEGRRITAYDPARNLVGRIDLAGETPEQIEMALHEGGTLVGRVVDADGFPMEGLSIGSALENWKPGMMGPTAAQKAQGSLITHLENAPTLTDKNGRFELKGILPGPKYSGGVSGPQRTEGRSYMSYLGYIFKDTAIEPGQTKDLGDLRIKPESDDEEKEEQEQKSEAKPKEKAPQQPTKNDQAKTNPAQPAAAATSSDNGNLRGRVVDFAGKPISGAKIHWMESRNPDLNPMPPRLLATTDAAGDFSCTPPPSSVTNVDEPLASTSQQRLVIIAPGHGFVLSSPQELRGRFTSAAAAFKNEVEPFPDGTIRVITLPPPGESIRGRLVNIDGQPISGVTIKIRWFDDATANRSFHRKGPAVVDDKNLWMIDRVSSLIRVFEPVQLRDVLPTATTDADGRFELRDLGADRLFHLLVQSDQAETKDLVVRNQSGEAITIPPESGLSEKELVLHPREFVEALGPSQATTGRVVDRDTGEPISGAVIRVY